jgi:hypothetical protein
LTKVGKLTLASKGAGHAGAGNDSIDGARQLKCFGRWWDSRRAKQMARFNAPYTEQSLFLP